MHRFGPFASLPSAWLVLTELACFDGIACLTQSAAVVTRSVAHLRRRHLTSYANKRLCADRLILHYVQKAATPSDDEEEEMDPAMAAMMGFGGFGGSKK